MPAARSSSSAPSARPKGGFGASTSATPSAHSSFLDTAESGARPDAASAGGTFDVCHAGLALRAVLYVQAVLGIGCLLRIDNAGSWLAVAGPVVFAGLFGTVGWLAVLCNARRLLVRLRTGARAAAVLGLGAACALAGSLALLPFAEGPGGPRQWIAVGLAGAALAGTLWSWLVLRVRARLPAEAAARLAELQSRIRPHFLFNALNTAIALVRVDPSRAEAVLEDLAELFRTALEDHGQATSLDDEIDLARRYLAIEQLRFGERLRVRWELDPAAGAAQVPPLLLQPLVENAVRHGVEPSPKGAEIAVRTRVRRGLALVDIVNTLPQQASRPGHGIALHNVRERLLLLHDVGVRFESGCEKGCYRVRIEVPLT